MERWEQPWVYPDKHKPSRQTDDTKGEGEGPLRHRVWAEQHCSSFPRGPRQRSGECNILAIYSSIA